LSEFFDGRDKCLLYEYVDRMNGNQNEKSGKRSIRYDDDVVLQILSIANGGASENDIKSRIKSLAASDTKLLQSYLEHLMDSGLIGYNDERTEPRVYITTDEGLRFLKSFERVETGADRHEPPKGLLHLD
jgi:predicted transcriptional regulator